MEDDLEKTETRGARELSDARTAYATDFFLSLGYDARSMSPKRLEEAFQLLSRTEELETENKYNGHNWEMTFASFARRAQAHVPLLESRAERLVEEGQLRRIPEAFPRWPGDARFALCLTHDIDILHEHLWRERWRALPHVRGLSSQQQLQFLLGFFKHALGQLAFVGRRTPPLEIWLELEERFGFKSTCCFVADETARPSWEDCFYRYADSIHFEGTRRAIGEVIAAVAERGWDVGLHGSTNSFASAETLAAERSSVEAAAGVPVRSVRQHHLCFDIRRTPRAQLEAGLTVDSTIGSNIDTVFRCGTGMPFFLYDLGADRQLELLEVPLVIQDLPLMRNFVHDEDLIVARCRELIERAASVGGAITLLWHNHHRQDSVEYRCYEKVLAAAKELGAWGCSMAELETWWRDRVRRLDRMRPRI